MCLTRKINNSAIRRAKNLFLESKWELLEWLVNGTTLSPQRVTFVHRGWSWISIAKRGLKKHRWINRLLFSLSILSDAWFKPDRLHPKGESKSFCVSWSSNGNSNLCKVLLSEVQPIIQILLRRWFVCVKFSVYSVAASVSISDVNFTESMGKTVYTNTKTPRAAREFIVRAAWFAIVLI